MKSEPIHDLIEQAMRMNQAVDKKNAEDAERYRIIKGTEYNTSDNEDCNNEEEYEID